MFWTKYAVKVLKKKQKQIQQKIQKFFAIINQVGWNEFLIPRPQSLITNPQNYKKYMALHCNHIFDLFLNMLTSWGNPRQMQACNTKDPLFTSTPPSSHWPNK